MNNIFKREKPNCNKSQSKFITNYVNYSLSNRTIFSNITPENNISKKGKNNRTNSIIMNDEKREIKKKSIIESYERSQ